jgi:NAD(P)-dependent dehydrogenase (short-subunit alcohol dehydrogenase family)
MMLMKKRALVAGASRGIGASIAKVRISIVMQPVSVA